MSARSRVAYGTDPSQYVELWQPEVPSIGVAVLIHGGYWRERYGLDLMDPMAAHLADRGWFVVNLEYRRIPTEDGAGSNTDSDRDGDRDRVDRDRVGVWDEMSADVLAGTRVGIDAATAGQKAGGGQRPLPIVLIGHSAGGHLSLWLAKALRERAGSELSDPQKTVVDLVVALAPVVDLIEADRLGLSDDATALLLGGHHQAVPGRYRSASPAEQLPLGVRQVIIHGREDKNVPHSISDAYSAAGNDAGDEVELIDTTCVDHFDIIDPDHWIWRAVDRRLALVSAHVDI